MKPDDKIPLPNALKDHFAGFELSEHQLEKLADLEQHSSSSPSDDTSPDRFSLFIAQLKRSYYPYVAALSLMMVIFISLPFVRGENLSRQVINEIAYNHNKQMAMEVTTPELIKITGYLSQLGFSLIKSRHLPDNEWELLGGRYCSIQGKLAAQLKLRNLSDNGIYTFYQALLPDAMTNLKQHESYVDGVKVSLWQENNLLLGLAGQPAH